MNDDSMLEAAYDAAIVRCSESDAEIAPIVYDKLREAFEVWDCAVEERNDWDRRCRRAARELKWLIEDAEKQLDEEGKR